MKYYIRVNILLYNYNILLYVTKSEKTHLGVYRCLLYNN